MKYSETVDVRKEQIQAEICLDYFNERIRVDHYYGNPDALHGLLMIYSKKDRFTKIIVKSKVEDFDTFLKNGYILEGMIPKYFKGSTAYFFTRYLENKRRRSDVWVEEDEILEKIYETRKGKSIPSLTSGFTMRIATEKDCVPLATLYDKIFKVYPTPLNNPAYISKTMHHDTLYYVIENQEGSILSAASAEMDISNGNAELTNCATLPEYRQYGFMKILLQALEQPLKERGIYCAYTIARAMSFGMNAAFFDLKYVYTGRLPNNCYIFESIEDMNLWVKDLAQ